MQIGARIGAYEVIAKLGEGGMGAVYRARDTKLNRDVALKVLLPVVANDAERLARFRRESQVLASLSHSNIGAIHALEEGGGEIALVLELVEGPTLADRIARGPIPVDEALPIAKQIAEALEAAHEQGIIHRDLKPANIKVRDDGTVKVLDFGLAKALDQGAGVRDQGSGALANSPTITTPAHLRQGYGGQAMTQAGMILGTAAYMAPEQAKGHVLDRRADLWAFGAVVYEMLTGGRAFKGEDVSDTLAAILRADPDWTALPPDTPPLVRRLLRRCLEKDRRRRLDSAAAARLEIDEALTAPAAVASAATPSPGAGLTPPRSAILPWAIAVAALVAAGVLLMQVASEGTGPPADRPLVRLDVDLGADVALPSTSSDSGVIISPDGTRIVYASGSPTRLFTRRLDQPNATELPGTQGAQAPFLSPDGRWVGFYAGGKLSKIFVDGGAAVPILDTASFVAASWAEDDSIFVSDNRGAAPLLRIPGGGSQPATEVLSALRSDELAIASMQMLPGGLAMLIAVDSVGLVDRTIIDVLTLADQRRKTLVRGGASPRYLATGARTGHLVYVRNATLFAIPFDLDTLETRGTAVPVVDDVAAEALVGTGQFDVSSIGTLVYRRAGVGRLRRVELVDGSGKRTPLLSAPGVYANPTLSPNGRKVAMVVVGEGGGDVWVYDRDRDAMTRLTFGGGGYRFPRWSPNGEWVVFTSLGKGLVVARGDGAGQPQVLIPTKTTIVPGSFSPDGRRLAYQEFTAASTTGSGGSQLWTVPFEQLDGRLTAGTPERFVTGQSPDARPRSADPSFSPDGRWLAYTSNESGTNQVYVSRFPPPASGQGGKWQVSTTGGEDPRWSNKRLELVYRTGDQLLVARYGVNGETFTAETPRVWIAKLGGEGWDLAPDGEHASVVSAVESTSGSAADHQVVFLFNFFDELRRRAPLPR